MSLVPVFGIRLRVRFSPFLVFGPSSYRLVLVSKWCTQCGIVFRDKDTASSDVLINLTRDVASSVVERRISNLKTLGSLPWQGRVSDSFSAPSSQILCILDWLIGTARKCRAAFPGGKRAAIVWRYPASVVPCVQCFRGSIPPRL